MVTLWIGSALDVASPNLFLDQCADSSSLEFRSRTLKQTKKRQFVALRLKWIPSFHRNFDPDAADLYAVAEQMKGEVERNGSEEIMASGSRT
jgi:hypothetical protein